MKSIFISIKALGETKLKCRMKKGRVRRKKWRREKHGSGNEGRAEEEKEKFHIVPTKIIKSNFHSLRIASSIILSHCLSLKSHYIHI